jgi:hypothetical protein
MYPVVPASSSFTRLLRYYQLNNTNDILQYNTNETIIRYKYLFSIANDKLFYLLQYLLEKRVSLILLDQNVMKSQPIIISDVYGLAKGLAVLCSTV